MSACKTLVSHRANISLPKVQPNTSRTCPADTVHTLTHFVTPTQIGKLLNSFFHASWHIFPGRCSNCPSRLLVLARVHVMNVFASVSLCNYKWQPIWWRSSADKFLKTGLGGVSVDEEVEAVYGSSFPRGVITINPEVINRQHCPILVMLCFMDMFCMCYFFSLLFFTEF